MGASLKSGALLLQIPQTLPLRQYSRTSKLRTSRKSSWDFQVFLELHAKNTEILWKLTNELLWQLQNTLPGLRKQWSTIYFWKHIYTSLLIKCHTSECSQHMITYLSIFWGFQKRHIFGWFLVRMHLIYDLTPLFYSSCLRFSFPFSIT